MSDGEVEVTSKEDTESGMSVEEKDQEGIGTSTSSAGSSPALGCNRKRRS
jgi:hypothetical protein